MRNINFKDMTYREIFLKADSYVVNGTIDCQEAEIKGRRVIFKTQRAFDICKGLKFFAQGAKFNMSEEDAIKKILEDGSQSAHFKLTRKQAQVFVRGIKGYLRAALEVLGLSLASNPDELVGVWLNQPVSDDCENADLSALKIISKLLKIDKNKYE